MAYNPCPYSGSPHTYQPNFDKIPFELKQVMQWVCWQYQHVTGQVKQAKVPYCAVTNRRASVTDPATWADFESCVLAVRAGVYHGIGFVLTADDPYVFIDFDVPPGATGLTSEQIAIGEALNSYSEWSPSGNGVHVIAKGRCPSNKGRRCGNIEVYNSARFMTMTGNAFGNPNIIENQAEIDRLIASFGEEPTSSGHIIDAPQTEDDGPIWERALIAANGPRFQLLWQGQWENLHPSQSEADYDLCEMLAFSCRNDPCAAQIARLFRQSVLGQRSKAQRDDYVFGTVARAIQAVAVKRDQQRTYLTSPTHLAMVAALMAAAEKAAT